MGLNLILPQEGKDVHPACSVHTMFLSMVSFQGVGLQNAPGSALLGSNGETSVNVSPQREAEVGHFVITSAVLFFLKWI